MAVFLSDDTIHGAFAALADSAKTKRRGGERTSGLLYFMAFDSVAARINQPCLDLSPTTPSGRLNRQRLGVAFTELVQVSVGPLKQIVSFGDVRIGGAAPSQRLSSNFLTTRLKQASSALEPLDYPKRPALPLLCLGTGNNRWGISRHDHWQESFGACFRDARSRHPFTHLAVLVLRGTPLEARGGDWAEVIAAALGARLSAELVELWMARIQRERRFGAEQVIGFQEVPSRVLDRWRSGSREEIVVLRERVEYLETVLRQHRISFER
jgi:hypothetical protein